MSSRKKTRVKQQKKRSLAKKIPSGDKRSRREEPNIIQQTPVWSFEVLDMEGPWGWNKDVVKSIFWTQIVPKLQNFETMTWSEINQATGGRTHGNNHHYVSVDALTHKARTRLSKINQDDIDAIFFH